MEALIQLREVSVRIDDTHIIDGVNLTIPMGKTLFVLGPAGSGKSTVLKTAAGLIPADEGEVLAGGKAYSRMGERELQDFRTYAGFVFQDAALWQNMTIRNNLLLPLRAHYPNLAPELAQRKVDEVIAKVGYEEGLDIRPAELSAGEQKLIGFARALMLDPMMLFLDAPLSLVDAGGAKRLMRIVMDLKKQGKTIVAVTNQLEFAFRAADRICILKQGRVWDEGNVVEIGERWPAFMEDLGPGARHALEERIEERNRAKV